MGQRDIVKLSLRWERVKTETCYASGENQRKAHTLAMNNDQQRKPNSIDISVTTVPPGDGSGELETDRNVRKRVSQWPMCQRDECWKLLGKRIRAVYVGQVAHCQLLKCANFLKLQSVGLVLNLFHSIHPPPKTVHMVVLCSMGKAPSASTPTSINARSNPKMCWTQSQPFCDTTPQNTPIQRVCINVV